MKKLLSTIFPISKTVSSKINGDLEITWNKGKKQLNSKNANYSYGPLDQVLKFGLKKIKLTNVKSILVLGLGGGGIIKTLREEFNYSKCIVAIEIDPVIIEIANSEFGIIESDNLKIHCIDAFDFIQSNTDTFDLIVIDLYIDLIVPSKFYDLTFWESVLNSKSSNGYIIFNAAVITNQTSSKIESIISFLKSKVYKLSAFEKVNNTNTVIIASGL